MRKIDCHTHIINQNICDEYFAKVDHYAIVMPFLNTFEDVVKCDALSTVKSNSRLFLSPCIDIHDDIDEQLKWIKNLMDDVPVVGLKIYLTYQSGRADDDRLIPVYEFANQYRLTITYHTGSCALILPSDNDLEGSNAVYVQNVARQFPNVNFVVAHMDDPRYEACAKIVSETPNMYTDVSGAYEPGTPEGDDISWAIATFRQAIEPYSNMSQKILYGTDFCPPIHLSAIDEYEETVIQLFPAKYHDDIYYYNALRAFPRLAELIKGEYV